MPPFWISSSAAQTFDPTSPLSEILVQLRSAAETVEQSPAWVDCVSISFHFMVFGFGLLGWRLSTIARRDIVDYGPLVAVRPGDRGPLDVDGVTGIGVYGQFSGCGADVAGDVICAVCARGDETQVLVQGIPAGGFRAEIIGMVEPDWIGARCDLAIDGDAGNISVGGGKRWE